MNIEDQIVGQRPDRPLRGRERPDGGRLGRLGRAALTRIEQVQADHRVEQARKQEALRPAHTRAISMLREAESDLVNAQIQRDHVLVGFMIGDLDEREVEAAEAEVEDAERRVRRYGLAIREVERRLGIIRDGAGNNLSALRGRERMTATETRKPGEATARAIEVYERALRDGPHPCREVGRRLDAAGVSRAPGAHARRILGVETVRGEDGVPRYAIPER
jgi:hypothetical protein